MTAIKLRMNMIHSIDFPALKLGVRKTTNRVTRKRISPKGESPDKLLSFRSLPIDILLSGRARYVNFEIYIK